RLNARIAGNMGEVYGAVGWGVSQPLGGRQGRKGDKGRGSGGYQLIASADSQSIGRLGTDRRFFAWGWRSDNPAAVAVFDKRRGSGLDGSVLRDLGKCAAGLWCACPAGNAFNLVLIGHGVLRRIALVIGNSAADCGDVEVSEAEVAIAGILGVW